jgi:hypothetical protein
MTKKRREIENMATRLEELEERLAAMEAEAGYGAYGEEAYAPYEEEASPYEEEMAGPLEEAFEGMSEEEIGAFSDTLEALETGQLRLEDLTPEEMGWFSRLFKKVAKVVKRVGRVVKPIWRVAKPVLSTRFPWMRHLPFEEEMAAPSMPLRGSPVRRMMRATSAKISRKSELVGGFSALL